MSPRGPLLGLGVFALFLAIFVPLALRVANGRDRTIDADRLRRTYVALSLYETEHDGLPAPLLSLVRRDVEHIDLQSVADPRATEQGASFPCDAAMPRSPCRARSRVSWSYRWHWREAGDPRARDPRKGLLADPWPGSLLRVGMDGALVDKPTPASLDFVTLFGR